MNIIPTHWSFRRDSFIPILKVEGHMEPFKDISQLLLMQFALEVINTAEKFNGRLISQENPQAKKPVTISFDIIFKNETDLNLFKETIEKKCKS